MKRIIAFLALSMIASTSFAFTLISENPHKFANQKVSINIDSQSCEKIGLSSERLLNLAVEAVDRTWNTVKGIRIKFIKGVTTSDPHEEAVLISCFNTIAHEGLSEGGIEGKYHFVKILWGASTATDEELMNSISHSFGHALGLGHSNRIDAHMSYSFSNPLLTDDDRDGYQYLYNFN